jgi:N-acetylglucosamine-6-phosphate deacetylase
VDVTLTGGRVVTPDGVLEQGWVAVRDGLIAAVGEGAPPDGPTTDVGGGWLVPGFVDIHCHGGGGEAFTSADPTRVIKAANAHRRHGTTTLLASLVSRPVPELADQVKALTELVRDNVVAGIHLEGPFLSARCSTRATARSA